MKLTLHSQLQSGGWILQRSASNHREGCSFDFSPFPRAHFLSSPDWSLHAGCVLNISQWWLILWAPAKELVISAGDAAASSLSSPLHLVFLKIPSRLFFFLPFSVWPGLLSLIQMCFQHATCGHFRHRSEVCLLCMFVCRTPKLPLWSATFEIWRMRSKCWRQTAY